MGQENLLSVHEVRLYVIAVVVAVFVEKGPYVIFHARAVVDKMVRREFKGHLVPNIHELFELVVPRIFEVESRHFLNANKAESVRAYQLTCRMIS